MTRLRAVSVIDGVKSVGPWRPLTDRGALDRWATKGDAKHGEGTHTVEEKKGCKQPA